MGPPKGKTLKVDRISENKLNAIKNNEIILKTGSMVLGVTPSGLSPETGICVLVSPIQ